MRIHLPAVYLLPGCTSRCTLNDSKKFSGQLCLLMYTYQSYLFPAQLWVLNSLQQLHRYMHKAGYGSGCASEPAPPWAEQGWEQFSWVGCWKTAAEGLVSPDAAALGLPGPSLPLLLLNAGHCAALCLQF